MSKPKCKSCKHLKEGHNSLGRCNRWKASKYGVEQCKCPGWSE